MDGILANAGFLAIALLIIYLIEKIDDYYFDKKIGTDISDKVYEAARAFAQGESDDEIRNILINSIDFDEELIEEILSIAYPHRAENDGGYHAFLEVAKKVLVNY